MHTEPRSQRIAVTGATGRVGSHLVEILAQRGHDVVPIARSKGVDVVTGEGVDEALVGVETIIDAATGPSPDQEQATAFFTASARNVQRAGASAGAKRIVVVSIIGIDKFGGGYNAAKVAQEQTLLEGPLPVRIVRAAQFHEFVGPLVGWTIEDGVAHVPEMRTQLVAARIVAEAVKNAVACSWSGERPVAASMMVSTPASAASRPSPVTTSTPLERAIGTTSCPRRARISTRWDPTRPVAPVTAIRWLLGSVCMVLPFSAPGLGTGEIDCHPVDPRRRKNVTDGGSGRRSTAAASGASV